MRNDIASPTAQPIHWIRTLILVEEAAAMGVPLSTALRGTRITPEQLGEPGVTITVIDQMRIIINVARALPDQPIGLNWGRLLDIHSFQTFGLWVCAHATLGELLDAVLRYQVMLNAVVVGRGSFVGPHYRLELHYPPAARPDASLVRINSESMWTSFLQIFRQLVSEPLDPQAVYFSHPAPPYERDYADIFRCPVHFDAPTTTLVFKREDMDRALMSHHPVLKRVHDRFIKREYEQYIQQHSLSALVRSHLINLPEQTPTSAPIARSLGISERTLRRRLEQEGTSFRQLQQDTLLGSARNLLALGLTVETTAQRLGYADASSFRRALKRICGITPSDLRAESPSAKQ